MDLFRRRSKSSGSDETDSADEVLQSPSEAPPPRPNGVKVVQSSLIDLPSMPQSSDDLLRTAAEYTRVHGLLESRVLPQLPQVPGSSAGLFFEQLRVTEPNSYGNAHDLFRPLLSLSSLGPTGLRAWVVGLASERAQASALVIDIKPAKMPKVVLIAFRLEGGGYAGYYCDPGVIEGWDLAESSETETETVDTGPGTGRPSPTTTGHRVTRKAEDAVSWTFELLEEVEHPEPPREALKHYEATVEPWRSVGIYSGSESEVRAILSTILSEWEKRPDFDKFTVRMHPQAPFIETFSYTISYKMGDRADEGDSFMPAVVWKTTGDYFAFGNHMFQLGS